MQYEAQLMSILRQICANILGDGWSPVLSVTAVCITLQSMLASCTVSAPSSLPIYLLYSTRHSGNGVMSYHYAQLSLVFPFASTQDRCIYINGPFLLLFPPPFRMLKLAKRTVRADAHPLPSGFPKPICLSYFPKN